MYLQGPPRPGPPPPSGYGGYYGGYPPPHGAYPPGDRHARPGYPPQVRIMSFKSLVCVPCALSIELHLVLVSCTTVY